MRRARHCHAVLVRQGRLDTATQRRPHAHGHVPYGPLPSYLISVLLCVMLAVCVAATNPRCVSLSVVHLQFLGQLTVNCGTVAMSRQHRGPGGMPLVVFLNAPCHVHASQCFRVHRSRRPTRMNYFSLQLYTVCQPVTESSQTEL